MTDGVSGLLVTPGEPARLHDAIASLVENPARAAEMGAAARAAVRASYTWESAAEKTLDALSRAASRR